MNVDDDSQANTNSSNDAKKLETKHPSVSVSNPTLPTATSGSMWNNVETAAQRIKRLENDG